MVRKVDLRDLPVVSQQCGGQTPALQVLRHTRGTSFKFQLGFEGQLGKASIEEKSLRSSSVHLPEATVRLIVQLSAQSVIIEVRNCTCKA